MLDARKRKLYVFDENAGDGDTGQTPSAFETFIGGLPEEMRTSKNLEKFAKSDNPANDIAIAYDSASKMIGKDPANLLDSSNLSDPNARLEFLQGLGAPKEADGYEFKAPEGVTLEDATADPVLNAMKGAAAKAGLMPDQFQAVVAAGLEALGGDDDGDAEHEERHANNVSQLQEQHGDMLENNVALIEHTMDRIEGGDKVIDALTEAGLDSNPAVFNFLLKIAEMTDEDTTANLDSGKGPVAANNLIDKAKDLQRQALTEPSRSRARELNEEAARLYARASGE